MAKVIVGIEDASYTKKDGSYSVGVRIHYEEDMVPPNIGKKAASEYIPNKRITDFELGEFTAFLYEPYANGKYYRCTGLI